MDRMLKNLRKKTHSQLWIVVAFVALFVLADQGAYADMMDSGGQEPSLTIPSTSYADTYNASASVDSGSYSYDNSYSYDFAPVAEAPNYVIDWNDSAATADWNANNPTNTYSGPVDFYQTSPDDWSPVGGEWSYTAPVDTYTSPSYTQDAGSIPDTSWADVPATYGEYGEFFEGGYSTIPSDAVMSSGADFPYGGVWDGGNTVFEPGVLQSVDSKPLAEPFVGPPAPVVDTSLSDDPSHYLGTYGRNFTPDDFQVDSGYTTSGDFIGPPAPVDTAAAAAIVSAIHIEKKGGVLEFIGGVAGGIAEHTLGAAGDIGEGIYKAGADHVYGPLIGTGNGDNFKPGVLTNAVTGTGNLASGAVNGTGQLLFGKEGDDSSKGLIGGGIDLTARTADWIYNEAIEPVGEHVVGVPIDIGKGVYKAGADHVYGPLIGTGNGDNFKPGVLTNAVDWGYNDLIEPVGGHVLGAAGDIGEGFYNAGKDHIIEPVFK